MISEGFKSGDFGSASTDVTTGVGGHTCPGCGQWVPNNTFHSCYSFPDYQYDSGYPTISKITLNERMVRALERIANALEKR